MDVTGSSAEGAGIHNLCCFSQKLSVAQTIRTHLGLDKRVIGAHNYFILTDRSVPTLNTLPLSVLLS